MANTFNIKNGLVTPMITSSSSSPLIIKSNVSLDGAAGTRTLEIHTNGSGNPGLFLSADGSDSSIIYYDRTNGGLGIDVGAGVGVLRVFAGGSVRVGGASSSALGPYTTLTTSNFVTGGNGSIGCSVQGGTGTLDTSISINQTDGGGTMLLLASRHTSSGTATESAVYIVRFYYDGNNAPTTIYVGGSTDFITFGVSGSNTLTLTNAGGGQVNYSWFGNK